MNSVERQVDINEQNKRTNDVNLTKQGLLKPKEDTPTGRSSRQSTRGPTPAGKTTKKDMKIDLKKIEKQDIPLKPFYTDPYKCIEDLLNLLKEKCGISMHK